MSRVRRRAPSKPRGRPSKWGEPTRRVSIRLPVSVAELVTTEEIARMVVNAHAVGK